MREGFNSFGVSGDLSLRFVHFCGGKPIGLVRLTRAPGTHLLLAAQEIVAQLLSGAKAPLFGAPGNLFGP